MVIVSIAPYFFKLHSVLFNCKYTVFVIIEFLFHSFIYFLFIMAKLYISFGMEMRFIPIPSNYIVYYLIFS